MRDYHLCWAAVPVLSILTHSWYGKTLAALRDTGLHGVISKPTFAALQSLIVSRKQQSSCLFSWGSFSSHTETHLFTPFTSMVIFLLPITKDYVLVLLVFKDKGHLRCNKNCVLYSSVFFLFPHFIARHTLLAYNEFNQKSNNQERHYEIFHEKNIQANIQI